MAYSKEQIDSIFNKVCSRIEFGEALRTILKDNEMPSSSTFYEWLDANKEKAKQYARATEFRGDAIFEEMLNISDNIEEGETVKIFTDGKTEIVTGDMIQHRRLKVDTRKWYLSKLNPKKYGDKTDITSNGENLEQPIFIIKK
ncbi:MAG: terminase small subunit protein [Flavobacteriales bacterium]|nr:terminase small subunit protein [Flavobacteriales bacterium]